MLWNAICCDRSSGTFVTLSHRMYLHTRTGSRMTAGHARENRSSMIWGHWLLGKTPIKQRLLVLRATLFLSMLPGLLDKYYWHPPPSTRHKAVSTEAWPPHGHHIPFPVTPCATISLLSAKRFNKDARWWGNCCGSLCSGLVSFRIISHCLIHGSERPSLAHAP